MKHPNILFTLIMLLSAIGARGAITGQWVMHPTFDNSVTRVIDTPTRTYFMGYNQQVASYISSKSSTDQTLFYYDKEGDEIVAAIREHALSYPAIDKIEYNPAKKYLFILYSNQDIDLLYDNGEVVNIPALLHADIAGARGVNGISFYPWRDHIWLATDFGYVLINDDRHEVEDSRNYGTSLSAATELGSLVILTTESSTYTAPVDEQRASLSDYTRSALFEGANLLYPLSESKMITNTYTASDTNKNKIRTIMLDGNTLTQVAQHNPYGNVSFCPTEFGLLLIYSTKCIGYDREGSNVIYFKDRPAQDHNIYTSASWNQKEYFTALPRKGLRSIRLEDDGTSTLTRDFMLPNAPNAYWSRAMAYHPTYGMLVNSHGPEAIFSETGVNSIREPNLLSALSGGIWKPLSPAYRNPEQTYTGYDPYGLVIDPADNRYVYTGSAFSGFTRFNLEDPQDIIHYTHPGDENASLPGYVETNPTQSWSKLCHFSAPGFDSRNTLWCQFTQRGSSDLELRYLTDADRRATTNAANARPWNKLIVPNVVSGSLNSHFKPLSSSANRDILLHFSTNGILVLNTAGTPGDSSDDKKVYLNGKIYDQDGGEVKLNGINCTYEDPETGFVWFGTLTGAFYLQPQGILRGQTNVNRIKVARNDGTSLADYLLNGVCVRSITADPQGRKWFGSGGAGIVVTSADGKNILAEFTTSNSDIPSNYIYNLCYNPATQSMMVSTEQGLCEFYIGHGPNASEARDAVRAYPNPVAPDYYGWVTIDGLPDNSLVKIVDASGNLVRELGRAESGSIQWDVLNLNSRRVPTGVYYVLSSPASGSGASNVAKILVMN